MGSKTSRLEEEGRDLLPEVEILVWDFLQKRHWEEAQAQNMAQEASGCRGSSQGGSQKECASPDHIPLPDIPLESHSTSLGLNSQLPNMASTVSTPWIHSTEG